MSSLEEIRFKVEQLKNETNNTTIHLSADDNRKTILETTYEVLAGLEDVLRSYAKR